MGNTSLTLTLNELLEAERNAKNIIERAEKKKAEILNSIPIEREFLKNKYKEELANKKAKLEKEFLAFIKNREKEVKEKIKREKDRIKKIKIEDSLVEALLEDLLRL